MLIDIEVKIKVKREEILEFFKNVIFCILIFYKNIIICSVKFYKI